MLPCSKVDERASFTFRDEAAHIRTPISISSAVVRRRAPAVDNSRVLPVECRSRNRRHHQARASIRAPPPASPLRFAHQPRRATFITHPRLSSNARREYHIVAILRRVLKNTANISC